MIKFYILYLEHRKNDDDKKTHLVHNYVPKIYNQHNVNACNAKISELKTLLVEIL